MRQFHLLRALSARGHRVTVVAPVFAFQHAELDPVRTLRDVGVDLVATRRHAPRGREATSAFLRRPQLVARAPFIPFYGLQTEMLLIEMRAALRGALANGVDVATIEHDTSAAVADLLPTDLPVALTLQNVMTAYYRRRAEHQRGLAQLASRREASTLKRYLARRIERFSLVVAVSDVDARLLDVPDSVRVAVVPNGTTARERVPQPAPRDGSPALLFTGSMSHPPNPEGILWFHREVWPRIVARRPQTRLVIVGRHPQPSVNRLADVDSRVTVTGEVPDVAPYYDQATVTIAPLKSGSGTRLKVLDSLAAGRPMVSTTVGCEGIAVTDDHDILIADDAESFASKTLHLLDSPAECNRIATAGRQLVLERYDWTALGKRYAEAIEALQVKG